MVENITDIEGLDLSEVLRAATENKISVDIPEPETQETATAPADAFAEDFDADQLNDANGENPGDQAADGAADAMFDSAQLAPAIIETVDVLQQQLLPALYEKTLDEDDRRAMKAMLRHYRAAKNKTETLDANGMRIMEIMCDYEEYTEKLPFTATEKKSLIVPLTKVLKNVNFQTTPENALMYAALMVAVPRTIPLAKNKFFGNKKEDEK